MFCAHWVCSVLHISSQRLSRQRTIKRAQFQQPTIEMMKSRVETERLGDFVVIPQSCNENFLKWWRALDDTVIVNVRYPHERHGNAGRHLILLKKVLWMISYTSWTIIVSQTAEVPIIMALHDILFRNSPQSSHLRKMCIIMQNICSVSHRTI